MTIWTLIGIAFGAMVMLMTALWIVQRVRGNAGIVDVAWSFGTGLTGVWFALGADGDPTRRTVVAILSGLWGLRLGWYLWRRVASESEDGRYAALRARLGPRVQPYLFGFFQLQAFWAVMFALPMLLAATNPTPAFTVWDLAALVVWVGAIGGETIADAQLARFRADPTNRGAVCRTGLWRYSRHPNYFFEWVHWWAYVLFAIGAPLWWLALGGPLVMLLFLLKVTGIPHTERQALRSRGDAYRDYQRTTSAFVPWPPRNAPDGGLTS